MLKEPRVLMVEDYHEFGHIVAHFRELFPDWDVESEELGFAEHAYWGMFYDSTTSRPKMEQMRIDFDAEHGDD